MKANRQRSETLMMSKPSQNCVEEIKIVRKRREFPETCHGMPEGKLIETLQICLRCGKKFPFKRSRKRCPICESLLRTKTMVLKVR